MATGQVGRGRGDPAAWQLSRAWGATQLLYRWLGLTATHFGCAQRAGQTWRQGPAEAGRQQQQQRAAAATRKRRRLQRQRRPVAANARRRLQHRPHAGRAAAQQQQGQQQRAGGRASGREAGWRSNMKRRGRTCGRGGDARMPSSSNTRLHDNETNYADASSVLLCPGLAPPVGCAPRAPAPLGASVVAFPFPRIQSASPCSTSRAVQPLPAASPCLAQHSRRSVTALSAGARQCALHEAHRACAWPPCVTEGQSQALAGHDGGTPRTHWGAPSSPPSAIAAAAVACGRPAGTARCVHPP